MSSTMNAEAIQSRNASKSSGNGNGAGTGSNETGSGRPEKPDDQKSTKTIQNKESSN